MERKVADSLCAMFPDLIRPLVEEHVRARLQNMQDTGISENEAEKIVLDACIDDALRDPIIVMGLSESQVDRQASSVQNDADEQLKRQQTAAALLDSGDSDSLDLNSPARSPPLAAAVAPFVSLSVKRKSPARIESECSTLHTELSPDIQASKFDEPRSKSAQGSALEDSPSPKSSTSRSSDGEKDDQSKPEVEEPSSVKKKISDDDGIFRLSTEKRTDECKSIVEELPSPGPSTSRKANEWENDRKVRINIFCDNSSSEIVVSDDDKFCERRLRKTREQKRKSCDEYNEPRGKKRKYVGRQMIFSDSDHDLPLMEKSSRTVDDLPSVELKGRHINDNISDYMRRTSRESEEQSVVTSNSIVDQTALDEEFAFSLLQDDIDTSSAQKRTTNDEQMDHVIRTDDVIATNKEESNKAKDAGPYRDIHFDDDEDSPPKERNILRVADLEQSEGGDPLLKIANLPGPAILKPETGLIAKKTFLSPARLAGPARSSTPETPILSPCRLKLPLKVKPEDFKVLSPVRLKLDMPGTSKWPDQLATAARYAEKAAFYADKARQSLPGGPKNMFKNESKARIRCRHTRLSLLDLTDQALKDRYGCPYYIKDSFMNILEWKTPFVKRSVIDRIKRMFPYAADNRNCNWVEIIQALTHSLDTHTERFSHCEHFEKVMNSEAVGEVPDEFLTKEEKRTYAPITVSRIRPSIALDDDDLPTFTSSKKRFKCAGSIEERPSTVRPFQDFSAKKSSKDCDRNFYVMSMGAKNSGENAPSRHPRIPHSRVLRIDDSDDSDDEVRILSPSKNMASRFSRVPELKTEDDLMGEQEDAVVVPVRLSPVVREGSLELEHQVSGRSLFDPTSVFSGKLHPVVNRSPSFEVRLTPDVDLLFPQPAPKPPRPQPAAELPHPSAELPPQPDAEQPTSQLAAEDPIAAESLPVPERPLPAEWPPPAAGAVPAQIEELQRPPRPVPPPPVAHDFPLVQPPFRQADEPAPGPAPRDQVPHAIRDEVIIGQGPDVPIARPVTIDDKVNNVLELFPDADPDHVRAELGANDGSVEQVIDVFLDPNTPPYKKKRLVIVQDSPDDEPEEEDKNDKKEPFESDVSLIKPEETFLYARQAEYYLTKEFKRVSLKSIRYVLKHVSRYLAARNVLLEGLTKADLLHVATRNRTNQDPVTVNFTLTFPQTSGYGTKVMDYSAQLLQSGRQTYSSISGQCPLILKELDYLEKKKQRQETKPDVELAHKSIEEDNVSDQEFIECTCCYNEVVFESMIQCYDGHLFCKECLERYAKEAVYGQGRCSLVCMESGCEAQFSRQTLMQVLPAKIFKLYESRVQEEMVNLADLPNLVTCPKCNYKLIMDDDNNRVFECQNPTCMKKTCRDCAVDWEEHMGKKCKEVEQKDETSLRTKFEEEMTKAMLRQCVQCKAQFLKSDGCNKMTCRCGHTMCYICRMSRISYNHFCQHPRDPGRGCTMCKSCSLWSSPEEDDQRALEEIRKKANEERRECGFDDDRLIGAPPDARPKNQLAAATARAPGPNVNIVRPQYNLGAHPYVHHDRHHQRRAHHHYQNFRPPMFVFGQPWFNQNRPNVDLPNMDVPANIPLANDQLGGRMFHDGEPDY